MFAHTVHALRRAVAVKRHRDALAAGSTAGSRRTPHQPALLQEHRAVAYARRGDEARCRVRHHLHVAVRQRHGCNAAIAVEVDGGSNGSGVLLDRMLQHRRAAVTEQRNRRRDAATISPAWGVAAVAT
jgi:hypothetical protein